MMDMITSVYGWSGRTRRRFCVGAAVPLRWRISRSAGPAMLERRLQPVVILLEISLRFPIMVLCNGHDHRRPRLAVRRQAG